MRINGYCTEYIRESGMASEHCAGPVHIFVTAKFQLHDTSRSARDGFFLVAGFYISYVPTLQ